MQIKFILTLLVLLLTTQIANSATIQEQKDVYKELQAVCNQYNKPCHIIYNNDLPRLTAFTTIKGDIILTKLTRAYLTKGQLKAVGLHEIGHHVLQHYQRQAREVLANGYSNKKQIRHKHEIEADLYATRYTLVNNEPNYLPSALSVMTLPQYRNVSTPTHPATTVRIKIINKYTNYYNTPIPAYTQPAYIRHTYIPKAPSMY